MTTKESLPLSDEELQKYEATRNLYAELKQGAKDMAAGSGRIVYSPARDDPAAFWTQMRALSEGD